MGVKFFPFLRLQEFNRVFVFTVCSLSGFSRWLVVLKLFFRTVVGMEYSNSRYKKLIAASFALLVGLAILGGVYTTMEEKKSPDNITRIDNETGDGENTGENTDLESSVDSSVTKTFPSSPPLPVESLDPDRAAVLEPDNPVGGGVYVDDVDLP